MNDTYHYVGFVVVWSFAVLFTGLVALLLAAYVRGFYRAIRVTAWMYRNSTKKNEVTRWQLIKNTFQYWNKMAWWGKNDTMSHSNGSVFYV